MEVLRNVTCDGVSLLEVQVDLTRQIDFVLPVGIIIAILGVLSISVAIFLLVLVLDPKDKRLPVPMSVFGIVLFFSATMGYVAIGMWILVPVSDNVCMARVWLGTIAVSMMLGASISRASQIKRLNQALHSIAKMEDMIQQKLWWAFVDLVVIVIVQLLILAVWQSVDPFRSVTVVYDSDNLTGAYECASDSLGFWAVEVAFLAIIVIYGMIEIYQAWNLPSQTNQSKWILFSLYNTIIVAAVCLPIISLVDGEKEIAIVAIVGLIFLFFQMQTSFMVPSFYSGIYRSSRSGSDGTTTERNSKSTTKTKRSQTSRDTNTK
eukprot:TRINITY_DN7652_c0_g1_i2.p1 TRINITY_DN7652_c0_g1~~TRINITY_DN7652_c0_g1_i2.p1  ORF type:complete len:364 (-),score=38.43 TRINITY_DN7652_c0_g1_i2:35-994(-)